MWTLSRVQFSRTVIACSMSTALVTEPGSSSCDDRDFLVHSGHVNLPPKHRWLHFARSLARDTLQSFVTYIVAPVDTASNLVALVGRSSAE